ncbi:MAG: glycerophosphodiester phosphodiesterase [Candidatus Aquiluna sp. XM-24bin5]|nr:MAG: glycerophosphodiester phosphodiesterase [Candidatus Aquiluna sp. XM-24bin5]
MLGVQVSETASFPYFDPPKPRLFAHRGLAQHAGLDENTIPAFLAALEHGATHLESDTQATADDVAVLFHDEDLNRVAGIDAKIRELSLSEIKSLRLQNGGEIPTLTEALEALPSARFNLDIKTKPAITPTISAIEALEAHDRVLVSSFSNPIRKSALRDLSKPIATSGSLSTVVAAWLSHRFLFGLGFAAIVRHVHAFQVPVSRGPIKFATKGFIGRAQRHQTEMHFWTINDPAEMRRLIALGADGIVSDRVDLYEAGK